MNLTTIEFGTMARSITENMLITKLENKLLTNTEGINEKRIGDLISHLEEIEIIDEKLLKSLKYSIFILDNSHEYKIEYDARINSLEKIYGISNKLSNLKDNFVEEIKKQNIVETLITELRMTYSCTIRGLLEKELNSILFENHNNIGSEEDYSIQRVILLTNSSELDELLCENLIEEYINIPRKKRVKVAEVLFEMKEELLTIEDIVEKIIEAQGTIDVADNIVNNDKNYVNIDNTTDTIQY